MLNNKRGQNITLGTIIMIILGIVVLVVLIFGFTTGWGNLWEKITGTTAQSNVDTIVQSCQIACSSSQRYEFCEAQRTINFGSEVEYALRDTPDVSEKVKSKQGTCEDFSKAPITGVSSCPGLC